MKKNVRPLATAAALVVLTSLAACGGGSSGSGSAAPQPPAAVTPAPVTPPVTPPVSTPSQPSDRFTLSGSCQAPRTGVSPTGAAYQDRQGTLLDELKWVDAYVNDVYLWYRELPTGLQLQDYRSPVDYFGVMKTSALTPSGRPKDRYHFTYPSDVWDDATNGIELGYGVTWSRSENTAPVRVWIAAMVEVGSPAARAGIQRGDRLESVDGVSITDNTSAGVATLNAGLFPERTGEQHRMVLSRAGASFSASMTAVRVAQPSVPNIRLLDTPTGKVGYLLFSDHNAVAETQLVQAISIFKAAEVSDVVLDMRYNGGGLLSIASMLAYMIAGPEATEGKIFEVLQQNDKATPRAPLMFRSTAVGYPALSPIGAGTPLPYLGLKRVTVLTTPGTCSASESVINSLRGIDIEVNLIGGETCGKPYAFDPAPNCGTTYFAIQYQGRNNKGFGEFDDGFQPTCRVSDDLTRPLGDKAEGMLAAALNYRAVGNCSPPQQQRLARAGAPIAPMQVVRPPIKQIAVRDR
ncbi:MAG: S41 family peptidase [Duganella sp.]